MAMEQDYNGLPKNTAEYSTETVSSSNVRANGVNKLLDRPIPEDYLLESTQRIAQAEAERRLNVQSAFIFRVGQEWMALPLACIREVVSHCKPHGLPHRGGIVLGLVSVRGELIVCISLAHQLELKGAGETSASSSYSHLIVVATEEGPLAFPADEVYGLHRYYADELREVPATLAEAKARFTQAILPWQEHTVGCLDAEVLFYSLNKNLS
jgi:chemotaxis-related protein WspD